MIRTSRLIVAALPIALLAACATSGNKTAQVTMPEATRVETPAPTPIADSTSNSEQPPKMIKPQQESSSPLARRIIYFDFDESNIKNEFRSTIRAHAEYLANHPAVHVRLEGYADERGTPEYNMALGERRGNSVLAFLTLQGVNAGQIETISYGEEHPVAMSHNESSWRLNRRVEIVYQ